MHMPVKAEVELLERCRNCLQPILGPAQLCPARKQDIIQYPLCVPMSRKQWEAVRNPVFCKEVAGWAPGLKVRAHPRLSVACAAVLKSTV